MYDLDTDPAIKKSTFEFNIKHVLREGQLLREVDLDCFGDFKKDIFWPKNSKNFATRIRN